MPLDASDQKTFDTISKELDRLSIQGGTGELGEGQSEREAETEEAQDAIIDEMKDELRKLLEKNRSGFLEAVDIEEGGDMEKDNMEDTMIDRLVKDLLVEEHIRYE